LFSDGLTREQIIKIATESKPDNLAGGYGIAFPVERISQVYGRALTDDATVVFYNPNIKKD
jgi:hypothetical protein